MDRGSAMKPGDGLGATMGGIWEVWQSVWGFEVGDGMMKTIGCRGFLVDIFERMGFPACHSENRGLSSKHILVVQADGRII